MEEENKILINKLIIEISKLNETALQQLFDITKNELFHIVRKYIKDIDLSHKVLSLSYLKIFKKSKSFQSQNSSGFDWMCNIVKEIALKYEKKDLKILEKNNHKCKEAK